MSKKKDKGWDYLNSDNLDELANNSGDSSYTNSDGSGSFYGADGSWGYKNSDGSSSYYGSDGSWGYKNSDGSGSYHGDDGSWGYRNSDGSSSYYGADGSWGYRNSDGSGSYYGGNGDDSESYNSDSDTNENDSVASGLGTLIGIGLSAAAVHAQNKAKRIEAERIQEQQERIERENRKAFRKTHKKGIAILIASLIICVLTGFTFLEVKLLIPVGISSYKLIGHNYENVVDELKDSGFSIVETNKISDLEISELNQDGKVSEVKIGFSNNFNADSKFPSNFLVTVTYHTVKTITPPMSAKEAKGTNYNEVVDSFRNAGFINVKTEPEYDIITGWLTKDGETESVSIGDDSKFNSSDNFRPDTTVVVKYHTLLKNKKK